MRTNTGLVSSPCLRFIGLHSCQIVELLIFAPRMQSYFSRPFQPTLTMSSGNNATMANLTVSNTESQPSVAVVILLGVLIVIGTLANGYVIAVLLKKLKRSPFKMTILNLRTV